MNTYKNIVVLTGAGISAESGVDTFRDADGLWSRYDVNDVATPEGFQRNPTLVHEFYNLRRQAHKTIKPNAAHFALAKLEQNFQGAFVLITQNVDALHKQAGSKNLIHMHGELHKGFCIFCHAKVECFENMSTETSCTSCKRTAGMRPDVVWFGEMPYHMDKIFDKLSECDLFISIGTSGTVYPAAAFVADAKHAGAHTLELNLEPSHGISLFAEAIHGKATEVVPAYIEKLLSAQQ
ncbi:MAG: NAD-dependent deacylase [Pseudomonadota bacterium]